MARQLKEAHRLLSNAHYMLRPAPLHAPSSSTSAAAAAATLHRGAPPSPSPPPPPPPTGIPVRTQTRHLAQQQYQQQPGGGNGAPAFSSVADKAEALEAHWRDACEVRYYEDSFLQPQAMFLVTSDEWPDGGAAGGSPAGGSPVGGSPK